MAMTKLLNVPKIDAMKQPFQAGVYGFGIGTIANVADKKLLQGKLTATGLGIGQSINGKPVTLNGTDALTYFAINGFKLKFTKKDLITGLIVIAIKKAAESYDYIDPPTALNTSDPRATNVTLARQQKVQYVPVQSSGSLM